MTSLVHIDERARRLYVGDALTHTFESLDANGQRIFAVEFDSGPISVHIAQDALNVTTVGRLFPSDLIKGRIVTLNPDGADLKMQRFLGNLRRPVHAAFADLSGDGQEDCVVSQFGNRCGRLSWFESRQVGAGDFREHVLSDRPGAIRVEVHDLTRDGRPDLIAMMGQAWEGIYLFENLGQNKFKETILIQQSPIFGYTYFEMIDWNRDGHLDLLTTNGDNAESASPLKFYHGVRLYLNDGNNHFTERWFFPLHGAYKARAIDFDLDGDLDIAAISYFPDYQNSPEESFVYLENIGNFEFRAASFPAATSGRWMTMDAGDLDGDGDADVVLGSLVLGPPGIQVPASIQSSWTNGAPAVLLLDNVQIR
jgi:hypothetical protein